MCKVHVFGSKESGIYQSGFATPSVKIDTVVSVDVCVCVCVCVCVRACVFVVSACVFSVCVQRNNDDDDTNNNK